MKIIPSNGNNIFMIFIMINMELVILSVESSYYFRSMQLSIHFLESSSDYLLLASFCNKTLCFSARMSVELISSLECLFDTENPLNIRGSDLTLRYFSAILRFLDHKIDVLCGLRMLKENNAANNLRICW